jgi:drug/metabolite transporter (DMT)-like permease
MGTEPALIEPRSQALPIAALLVNAFVWGVSWWPFRQLQGQGLHPLWATVLIYLLAVLAITLVRPRSWRELFATPVLWVLVLASGTTNAAFNWAVTIGDVVRVILLFYLMPLWAVLLARVLLHERITGAALLRVALAMAGAAVVLQPAHGDAPFAFPLPRTLAEWLAIVGGFSFALNNVMLRREAQRSEGSRALAMFLGGALVAGVLAVSLSASASATVPWPPAPAFGWVAGALAMGAAFLVGNLALQHGASRLPANVTAVVMIAEVLFASGSAVLLGAGVVTLPLALGGALIVSATLLAARDRR